MRVKLFFRHEGEKKSSSGKQNFITRTALNAEKSSSTWNEGMLISNIKVYKTLAKVNTEYNLYSYLTLV